MTAAQIDSTTLQKFREGDRKAFNAVFQHFNHPIKYFCFKLTGNKEDAEEIALQTLHKLLLFHDKFETEPNMRAFLYITARNACFDYLRTLKRKNEKQKKLAQDMMLADEMLQYPAMEGEILQAVYQEISKLPPSCKKVFTLLYVEDLTPQEVAAQMKITVDNVYSQKRNALKMLRLAFMDVALISLWIYISDNSHL